MVGTPRVLGGAEESVKGGTAQAPGQESANVGGMRAGRARW